MTQRNIAVSIILTIVTCGIYGIVWFVMLNDEIRNASKDYGMPSGGVAFLLTIVTCGIYGIYGHIKWAKPLLLPNKKLDCQRLIILYSTWSCRFLDLRL